MVVTPIISSTWKAEGEASQAPGYPGQSKRHFVSKYSKKGWASGMVAHTYDSSTQEAEEEEG